MSLILPAGNTINSSSKWKRQFLMEGYCWFLPEEKIRVTFPILDSFQNVPILSPSPHSCVELRDLIQGQREWESSAAFDLKPHLHSYQGLTQKTFIEGTLCSKHYIRTLKFSMPPTLLHVLHFKRQMPKSRKSVKERGLVLTGRLRIQASIQ